MVCIDRPVQGWISSPLLTETQAHITTLIERLNQQRLKHAANMMRARQALHERQAARRLREEQEAAYERSLQADREKQRKQQEELQRIQQQTWIEEYREKYRVYLRRHGVPEEPAQDDAEPCARLGIRMADGQRIMRRFRASDTLEVFPFFLSSSWTVVFRQYMRL